MEIMIDNISFLFKHFIFKINLLFGSSSKFCIVIFLKFVPFFHKEKEKTSNRMFESCSRSHPGGIFSTYAYGGGGQSKKFSCNSKISAHFIYINLYMNMKHPETMQIEVRIASSKPYQRIS